MFMMYINIIDNISKSIIPSQIWPQMIRLWWFFNYQLNDLAFLVEEAETLAYLDGKGPKPPRFARVVMVTQSSVMEYKAGLRRKSGKVRILGHQLLGVRYFSLFVVYVVYCDYRCCCCCCCGCGCWLLVVGCLLFVVCCLLPLLGFPFLLGKAPKSTIPTSPLPDRGM